MRRPAVKVFPMAAKGGTVEVYTRGKVKEAFLGRVRPVLLSLFGPSQRGQKEAGRTPSSHISALDGGWPLGGAYRLLLLKESRFWRGPPPRLVQRAVPRRRLGLRLPRFASLARRRLTMGMEAGRRYRRYRRGDATQLGLFRATTVRYRSLICGRGVQDGIIRFSAR